MGGLCVCVHDKEDFEPSHTLFGAYYLNNNFFIIFRCWIVKYVVHFGCGDSKVVLQKFQNIFPCHLVLLHLEYLKHLKYANIGKLFAFTIIWRGRKTGIGFHRNGKWTWPAVSVKIYQKTNSEIQNTFYTAFCQVPIMEQMK